MERDRKQSGTDGKHRKGFYDWDSWDIIFFSEVDLLE